MSKPTGFLKFDRQLPHKRPVTERKNDYNEFVHTYSDESLNQQAARCMDCGVPFCHSGCPLVRFFLLQIISRSLLAGSVPHPASLPVCLALMKILLPLKR